MKKNRFLALAAAFLCYGQSCTGSCIWVEGDYLYWTIQSSPEPVPLVIEGQQLAIPPSVLGSPDTKVVLGGKGIDLGWRSGGRAVVGSWFGCDQCFGAEASYWILPTVSKKYTVRSDGSVNSPFLLVPFYNVLIDAEDSTAIASNLLQFQGKGTLELNNWMQSAEAIFLANIPCCFQVACGFLYWNFNEELTFRTNSPFIPPHVIDTYKTRDKFSTVNNFYGLLLGLNWQYEYCCFSFAVKANIGLGAMCEKLNIQGYLITNDYNGFQAVIKYPGGYFALPTNIGKKSDARFAVLPAIEGELGYEVCDFLKFKVGYDFLYASSVLWAGKQIDRKLNPSQAKTYTNALTPSLVGEARPRAQLKSRGLWVQGLKVGVEFTF